MDQHGSKQTAVKPSDDSSDWDGIDSDTSTSESDSGGNDSSTTEYESSSSDEEIRDIVHIVPKIIPDDATLPPLPPILPSPSTAETDAHYTVGTVAGTNQTIATTIPPTTTATANPAPQSLQIVVYCPFVCVFLFLILFYCFFCSN